MDEQGGLSNASRHGCISHILRSIKVEKIRSSQPLSQRRYPAELAQEISQSKTEKTNWKRKFFERKEEGYVLGAWWRRGLITLRT